MAPLEKSKSLISLRDISVSTLRFMKISLMFEKAPPWTFEGKILVLKHWSPNFHPSKDVIDKTPIWIRLSGLPVEYWDREIIISLVSKAGKPLRVDEQCLSLDHGLYACVCVEVDLSIPLDSGVNVGDEEDLDSFSQLSIYKNLPKICF